MTTPLETLTAEQLADFAEDAFYVGRFQEGYREERADWERVGLCIRHAIDAAYHEAQSEPPRCPACNSDQVDERGNCLSRLAHANDEPSPHLRDAVKYATPPVDPLPAPVATPNLDAIPRWEWDGVFRMASDGAWMQTGVVLHAVASDLAAATAGLKLEVARWKLTANGFQRDVWSATERAEKAEADVAARRETHAQSERLLNATSAELAKARADNEAYCQHEMASAARDLDFQQQIGRLERELAAARDELTTTKLERDAHSRAVGSWIHAVEEINEGCTCAEIKNSLCRAVVARLREQAATIARLTEERDAAIMARDARPIETPNLRAWYVENARICALDSVWDALVVAALADIAADRKAGGK
jgi:hypothetical protein